MTSSTDEDNLMNAGFGDNQMMEAIERGLLDEVPLPALIGEAALLSENLLGASAVSHVDLRVELSDNSQISTTQPLVKAAVVDSDPGGSPVQHFSSRLGAAVLDSRVFNTTDLLALVSSNDNSTNKSQNSVAPQNARVAPSGDYQINTLLGGSAWDSPRTITYSFLTSIAASSYYGSETVSKASETINNNVRKIIESVIEPLINVNFVEVADSASSYGQMRYMFSDGPGYAYA